MTPEQRSLCLDLKPHIDRINKTGTYSLEAGYYAKLNEVHRQLYGQPFSACRSCMFDALKKLYREALNG
jgi:hypothetical protein